MANGKPGPAKGSPKVPGSGRKKGSLNKRTQKIEEMMASFDLDPVEFLMKVVNDELTDKGGMHIETTLPLRVDAAKSLSPYFRSRKPNETSTTSPPKMNLVVNLKQTDY